MGRFGPLLHHVPVTAAAGGGADHLVDDEAMTIDILRHPLGVGQITPGDDAGWQVAAGGCSGRGRKNGLWGGTKLAGTNKSSLNAATCCSFEPGPRWLPLAKARAADSV